MFCRYGPVSEVSQDAVHGPVSGRTVAPSRVAGLLALMTNKKTGFKPGELIVLSRHAEDERWWLVNKNHWVTAAQ